MVAYKLRDGRVVRPELCRNGENTWRIYAFSEQRKRKNVAATVCRKPFGVRGLTNHFETETDADATLRALIRTAQKSPSSVLFAAEELR
ncbi:MAG: hypothetical protein IKU86_12295 [Thermoguttaceae bacterium]|nr:hypothetical protein [Thermoguttaceae bacterium]